MGSEVPRTTQLGVLSGKSKKLSFDMVCFKCPFLKSQIFGLPYLFNARLMLSEVKSREKIPPTTAPSRIGPILKELAM